MTVPSPRRPDPSELDAIAQLLDRDPESLTDAEIDALGEWLGESDPTDTDDRAEDDAAAGNADALDDVDLSHDWHVAADVPVDDKFAKLAYMRQHHVVKPKTTVKATDVYCRACRLSWPVAVDEPCSARINNEHLIGGDQSTRAKRNKPELPADAVVVAGPRINRRGIEALVLGP